jgi:hypothetical protein
VIVLGGVGCELSLDFDRTKIDGGSLDASFSDAPPADNFVQPGDAADSGADVAPEDAAEDAGTDADAGTDTGADTGGDALDAAQPNDAADGE